MMHHGIIRDGVEAGSTANMHLHLQNMLGPSSVDTMLVWYWAQPTFDAIRQMVVCYMPRGRWR
jgi:hypothetical protein